MTTTTKPKQTRLARLLLFVAGLTSSPPTGSKSIVLLGTAYTVAQLLGLLKPLVTALQAVASTKSTYSKAVAAANAVLTSSKATLAALRPALIQAYGADAQGLAACGIVVKVRTPKTAAQNTVRSMKAAATRKEKGTDTKAPQPSITVTDVDGTVYGSPEATPVATPANAAAPAPVVAPAAGK